VQKKWDLTAERTKFDICRKCPLPSGMPTVRGPWPQAERSVAPQRPIVLEAGSKRPRFCGYGPPATTVATDLDIRRAPTQHAKEWGDAVQPIHTARITRLVHRKVHLSKSAIQSYTREHRKWPKIFAPP